MTTYDQMLFDKIDRRFEEEALEGDIELVSNYECEADYIACHFAEDAKPTPYGVEYTDNSEALSRIWRKAKDAIINEFGEDYFYEVLASNLNDDESN